MKKSKLIPVLLEVLSEFSDLLTIALSRGTMQSKLLKLGGISAKNYYQGIQNLKHRKILRSSGDDLFFTAKGREWIMRSKFNYFKLKNKTWDKKWRVIIFDVPQELHNERTKFRCKLKNLGFYQLQKSVFVMPFPCEEELAFLSKNLSVGDYVDILVADRVGFKEQEIKKYYGL